MEPLLNDITQFIAASVNFLITTAQANYVIRLEELFLQKKIPLRCRTKLNWWFLFLGWWVLTGTSILVVARILLRGFIGVEDHYQVFVPFDLVIVGSMLLGYSLLALVALLAWDWRPWRKSLWTHPPELR